MEFVRPKKPGLSLDMAPLIDIVFQLLIFFMLSSSFLTPSLKLTLPRAVQQDQKVPEHIVVSINKEGSIYLNTLKTSLEDLKDSLEVRLGSDTKKSIHIRGDKEMPYKYFVEVMDLARQAGAKQINVVHQSGSENTASQQQTEISES